MSLPHAILGFLSHEPMTGYDLKMQCFDYSVAHFWPADQAQIYRTLDKLYDQGLVTSHVEIQADRPNRKVYTITDDGLVELRRWLMTPQGINVYREPLLIQVFFSDLIESVFVADLIRQQIADHQKRIAHYEAIPMPTLDTRGLTSHERRQRLTLELGLRAEAAYLEWLELALGEITSSQA